MKDQFHNYYWQWVRFIAAITMQWWHVHEIDTDDISFQVSLFTEQQIAYFAAMEIHVVHWRQKMKQTCYSKEIIKHGFI